MKPAQTTFIALFLLLATSHGYEYPSWYNCDTANCVHPRCQCASTNPPIALADTPQFVVISNDDAVDATVVSDMTQMIGSIKQTNGCRIPATWFTTAQGTDCTVVQQRYQMGDEFATHTITHPQLDLDTPKSDYVKEIVGGRDYLINQCKLPASAVKGYRSTFLVSTPITRQVLAENGFSYDSSMTFDFGEDANPAANRSWPFTLDFGVPDNSCSPTDSFQSCTPTERYPGLWEIPVWEVQSADGQSYGMDPGASSPGNGAERPVFDVMKFNFDASYAGNRAPVPIFVHAGWFEANRIADTEKFINYALSKPDVYFVTFTQLIQWMQNPVPNAQIGAWLSARCNGAAPGPVPGPIPDGPTTPLSWESDSMERPALMGRKMI